MGKNSQNLPSPWGMWYLIYQCLGRPHSQPQMAARSLHALSHKYAVKSLLVTMGRPISPLAVGGGRSRAEGARVEGLILAKGTDGVGCGREYPLPNGEGMENF